MSQPGISGLRAHWDEQGYIAMSGVIDGQRTAALRTACDGVLEQFLAHNPETGEPGSADGKVMRHLNRPSYFRDNPEGFQTLMHIVADPAICEIVEAVLGEPPLFRSTSYWHDPQTVDRNGNWHRDVQFLYPALADQQRLIEALSPQSSVQVMLALAPTEDNEFVPGSHLRWDTDEEFHIRWADEQAHNLSDDMPGAVRLRQEPGDVIAFHPYGLHRGRYRRKKLRRTLMLTYSTHIHAREDYFSDQPWCATAGYLDDLDPFAQQFFGRFIEAFTPFWGASDSDPDEE
jgi:ectoine hydroxylase-related dioxygenase (phytanoyl-CoA dioxygenase family)